jgi:hypothetical protein
VDDEKNQERDASQDAGEPDERAREEAGDQEIILTGRSGEQAINFVLTGSNNFLTDDHECPSLCVEA